MRPAGRGTHQSLYFNYPEFPAPDRDGRAPQMPVAIIGAGPVGLFAALSLARFGVRSVVFDDKTTFNDGSRAICLQRSSMHALQRAGAVDPFVEKALGWTTGRTLYRGQQILEFHMAHSAAERYLPMYNVQQQYIEQFLWQAADRNPLIELRWGSRLTGLADRESGINLTIDDGKGTYDCRADWVLAADGARSTVRQLRGLRLQGNNFPGRYVIADVQMDHDYPTIRRALFDSKSNPDKTILLHRQPDNIWRIDYQLPDGQSEEDAVREEVIRENVARILTDIGHDGAWDLEWWSIYSANTLALDDYRDGRVFFIGDAAHIVPIFGVRGLNNGLADAENAAWKLARVLNSQSDEKLLQSYTPERRAATMDIFANASKSARFMTPPGPGWTLMRDAALQLALDHDWAGDFANPRQMEPFTYAEGGAILTGPVAGANVQPGTVLPDEKLADDVFLNDIIGNSFTLITLKEARPDVGAMRQADPDLRLITGAGLAEAYGEDALARVQTLLGRDVGILLIRPDGYIAGVWPDFDETAIAGLMQQAFGRNGGNK